MKTYETIFIYYEIGMALTFIWNFALWLGLFSKISFEKVVARTLFWPFYAIKIILFRGVSVLNIFIDDMLK